jgi:hypothetical protein
MTEPAAVAMLQTQLAQQRETLRRLLLRFVCQAPQSSPHPYLLRGLVEIRADLAETKARLRLLGVPIEDAPNDAEHRTAVAQARPVHTDTPEHTALRSRLDRQRAFLTVLLLREARAGLATSPTILRAIAEVRAELAQTKLQLGVPDVEVVEHPDNTPIARASKAAAALESSPFVLSPDQRAALLAQLARRYQEQAERALVPQGHFPLRLRDRSDAVDLTWQGLRPHVARPVHRPRP